MRDAACGERFAWQSFAKLSGAPPVPAFLSLPVPFLVSGIRNPASIIPNVVGRKKTFFHGSEIFLRGAALDHEGGH